MCTAMQYRVGLTLRLAGTVFGPLPRQQQCTPASSKSKPLLLLLIPLAPIRPAGPPCCCRCCRRAGERAAALHLSRACSACCTAAAATAGHASGSKACCAGACAEAAHHMQYYHQPHLTALLGGHAVWLKGTSISPGQLTPLGFCLSRYALLCQKGCLEPQSE